MSDLSKYDKVNFANIHAPPKKENDHVWEPKAARGPQVQRGKRALRNDAKVIHC